MSMELKVYIERLKSLNVFLHKYLDNELQLNEFMKNVTHQKIKEDKQLLKDMLYLVSNISSNYHRMPNLFSKLESILIKFKTDITSNFSNLEIFKIFNKSKKMLLFLFDENILIPDQTIFNIITDYKHTKKHYLDFFSLEFKDFLQDSSFSEELELFKEKRKIGENEDQICQLIRNDSLNEFINYVSKNNISLYYHQIKESIFETNPLLIGKNISLIEYAAFFGSIQIFKYLKLNKVPLVNTLWVYAIHGKNPELFHILEENNVTLNLDMKEKSHKESIKCHHNEFTEYIENNFFDNFDKYENIIDKIKHHNLFSLFDDDSIEYSKYFFYLCKYDHFCIVKDILNTKEVDVNLICRKEIKDKKDGYELIFPPHTDFSNIKKYYVEECTPLCAAIIKGNKEIVQLLLEQKEINVNANFVDHFYFLDYPEDEIKTLLFVAVENEHFQIVQLLLDKVNVNGVSKYTTYSKELGGTLIKKSCPLHMAVEKQNIEILKCLLNVKNVSINSIEKINLSHIDFFQKTAMHIAIEKRNQEIVQLLLDKNINQSINYRHYIYQIVSDGPNYNEDVEINSSLMHAYKYSNLKIIGLLLSKKCLLI